MPEDLDVSLGLEIGVYQVRPCEAHAEKFLPPPSALLAPFEPRPCRR